MRNDEGKQKDGMHERGRGQAESGTGERGGNGGDSLAAGGVEAQGRERAREIGQMTAPLEGSVVHSLLSLPSFSSLNAYFHHFA